MEQSKWVYSYSELTDAEAHAGSWDDTRGLLGGKGANLAKMAQIGIPVPPGFTITTEACNAYLKNSEQFPDELWNQVKEALSGIQKILGREFGGVANPLLVSCRSGAKFSMPGMMDTVLNIGLNDEITAGLCNSFGDERFPYDAYRRLIHMFGSVVLEVPDEEFEHLLDAYKKEHNCSSDVELTGSDWKSLCDSYKAAVKRCTGSEFPQDVMMQLRLSVEAVFKSWNGKRAKDYRRAAGISDDLGTAVNIVSMVFGNVSDTSGTGVLFTRNPSTGNKKLYGEYLLNAQGEDIVAGIRNTKNIDELKSEMPSVYNEIVDICSRLEQHYKNMQDIELTIENSRLWILQTRAGKRTPAAAVKIAVDMVEEGLISKKDAVLRVSAEQVNALLHPQFEGDSKDRAVKEGLLLAKGLNASPGAAVGQACFDADSAEKAGKAGSDVILVRPFTKPDDIHGMLAAKGLLTSEGGATSHAAVVARQFGTPCICGASGISINLESKTFSANGVVIKEGDWISLDGTTGEVFEGQLKTVRPAFEEQKELLTLLSWADEICAEEGVRSGENSSPTRGLQVWANADYPDDARRAIEYGAQGIGLCRTEHMFFEKRRLPIVRRMIMAESLEERRKALEELKKYQVSDFEGIFEVMEGKPVIIRLIDPPMHEFLPSLESLIEEVVEMKATGREEGRKEKEKLLAKVRQMHESNPMMGLRGVRLSIVMPEIAEMQVRAILEAAANVGARGKKAMPEIMVPLTGHVNELKLNRQVVDQVVADLHAEGKTNFSFKYGTMIEIPRAALTSGEIASVAEFFSFGTNDLTQMTFGYSRDDAEKTFLGSYVEKGILPSNPFQSIDVDGVGRLMDICTGEGRKARPDLEVGICGEHGGDDESIKLCHRLGLNYVSCSPFRVAAARLSAAHAALM